MTQKEIEALTEGQTLYDSQVRGLHVRAFKDKRTFYLYFRTKSHVQRRPKLGDYPMISIAMARRLAMSMLAEVATGKDPGAREEKRTLNDLFDHYIKTHAVKQAQSTAREYARIWEKYVLPYFGKSRLISSISEQDCVAFQHSMRKSPYQCNRVMAVFRASYNLAEDWGWIPRGSNPVRVKLSREEARERYPDKDETARLIKALSAYENKSFADFVWILMLTGARPGEILSAKWSYLTQQGLVLPQAKARKKGRLITLSPAAREAITKQQRMLGNPYIFPGAHKGSHLKTTKDHWRNLCEQAGISGLQLRDLRRFYASIGLSNGVSLDQVGQLLGHTQSQTTRRYAYLMADRRQDAANVVAGQLLQFTSGSSRKR